MGPLEFFPLLRKGPRGSGVGNAECNEAQSRRRRECRRPNPRWGMPEAKSLPPHKNKPRNLIPRLQGLPDLT